MEVVFQCGIILPPSNVWLCQIYSFVFEEVIPFSPFTIEPGVFCVEVNLCGDITSSLDFISKFFNSREPRFLSALGSKVLVLNHHFLFLKWIHAQLTMKTREKTINNNPTIVAVTATIIKKVKFMPDPLLGGMEIIEGPS